MGACRSGEDSVGCIVHDFATLQVNESPSCFAQIVSMGWEGM